MDAEFYKADPCGASSLPFWKTNSISVPEDMMILRDDAYTGAPEGYSDTVYFRMIHFLNGVSERSVPKGYKLIVPSADMLAGHISDCYDEEMINPEELIRYRERSVYRSDLWIALTDSKTGRIAASGIGELDDSIGEGILEWIQVSPDHRRSGLGSFIVNELLCRMKGTADFATVSGRMENRTDPHALYESCGFRDPVLWHVLRKIRNQN